jgi:hypothetical protein
MFGFSCFNVKNYINVVNIFLMCLHDNVSNIMKTRAMIWYESNENTILKKTHNTL